MTLTLSLLASCSPHSSRLLPGTRSRLLSTVVLAALAASAGCASDEVVGAPILGGADGQAGNGDASLAGQDAAAAPDGSGGLIDVAVVDPDATAPGPDAETPLPDSSVTFPDGTTTEPDAGVTQPDSGTAVDGILVQPDAGPAKQCPGECGQYVEGASCQCDPQCAQYGDCCSTYQAECSGTVDPGPGPGPSGDLLACAEKNCSSQVKACQANTSCAGFLTCAAKCTDQNCLLACGQQVGGTTLQQLVFPLYQCADGAGCLDQNPNPGPTGPVCGDGTCEQPENKLNCDKDCDNAPSAAQQCIYDKCNKQYTDCFANTSCVAALACFNETGNVQQCAADNPQGGQLLSGFLQCGQQQGCLGGGQPQPTGPVCGDGKCESPENKLNCSKDCTTEPSATQQCIYDKCNKQYTDCFGDAACLKAVACYNQTQSVQQCAGGSQTTATKLQSMLQCGQQQGCFNTPPPPPPTGTCAGKCGQFQAGASCQCISQCKQFGNCCSDYAAQCEAPANKCGDGICDSASENSSNCPADCGTAPAIQCKSKADCKSSEICCGKADGSQVCALPADCK